MRWMWVWFWMAKSLVLVLDRGWRRGMNDGRKLRDLYPLIRAIKEYINLRFDVERRSSRNAFIMWPRIAPALDLPYLLRCRFDHSLLYPFSIGCSVAGVRFHCSRYSKKCCSGTYFLLVVRASTTFLLRYCLQSIDAISTPSQCLFCHSRCRWCILSR